MIRLLIIGRDADEWREGLARWEGASLEIDAETLPAAGIRSFEEHSPDAVAIAEPEGSPRIEAIAKAVEERPLGRIVPLLTLGSSYRGEEDLSIAAEVGASAGPRGLVGRLEEVLEVDLDPSRRHAETASDPNLTVEPDDEDGLTQHSTEIPTRREDADDEQWARDVAAEQKREEVESRVEHRDYVIEPVEEESSGAGAEPQEGAGSSGAGFPPAEPDEIRRKLEEVRHEDYFAILEVPKAAAGEEVRQAYRGQKRRFRPQRLADDLSEEYEAELAEIHDGLDDARAVLGDDELREMYRSQVGGA